MRRSAVISDAFEGVVSIIGRTVATKVKRGDTSATEVCEVLACELNPGGSWHLLVSTHDGSLLRLAYDQATLVAPIGGLGPYR